MLLQLDLTKPSPLPCPLAMALRDYLPRGVELISYVEGLDGWSSWQLAVDGTPCVPFDIHASSRERFLSEASFALYLVNSAKSLIARYGDGRDPRPEPEDIGLNDPEALSLIT